MKRKSLLLVTHTAVALGGLAFLTACSSSIDNGTTDSGAGGTDAPAPTDSMAPDSTAQDSMTTDSGKPDVTVTDSGSGDVGTGDAGGNDASEDTLPTLPDGGTTPGDGGVCATATMVAPGKTAVAIACNQTMPANILVNSGILYWTNYTGGGQVMSMPVTGGVPTVVASNQDYPWNLTIDANNLYWTNYDGGGAEFPNGAPSNSGAIFKVAINTMTGAATGTPTMLDSSIGGPWGIVVDSTNVYFTAFGGNRIKSVPIAGGAETVLASIPNGNPGGTPMALVQDSTNLYWETENGVVASIAKTAVNGTPKILVPAAAVTGGYGLAISGSTLYFTDQSSIGHIYSLPVAGGKPPLVLASMTNTPSSLAVNGSNIYWTNYLGNGGTCTPSMGTCGELATVPLAGGAVTVDQNDLDYPIGVAVDSSGVYIAASAGGRIWKLTPP